MTATNGVERLTGMCASLASVHASAPPGSAYDHMGATIADAILQAGLNYRTVVQPRVRRLMEEFPEAETTTGFLNVIAFHGLKVVLNWRHPEKPRRILEMTWLLANEGIETESDLREWLEKPGNDGLLLGLRGVGPKTADYLKMLVGLPSVAVDRHLRAFVEAAGIECNGYDETRRLLESAADSLGVDRRSLDKAIWSYMSSRTEPGEERLF